MDSVFHRLIPSMLAIICEFGLRTTLAFSKRAISSRRIRAPLKSVCTRAQIWSIVRIQRGAIERAAGRGIRTFRVLAYFNFFEDVIFAESALPAQSNRSRPARTEHHWPAARQRFRSAPLLEFSRDIVRRSNAFTARSARSLEARIVE